MPDDRLSMFLAGSASPLVHGDVENLSEVGACVLTDKALDDGGSVTVDVKSGYSFLFRAEARIVWRSSARTPGESFDCAHGLLFVELSSFARKLIRRMGGIPHMREKPPSRASDADSDPDLQVFLYAPSSPGRADEDRFDLLTDPALEGLLFDEHRSARRLDGTEELSGNLGYFDNADVLQMLEATRATGVLYIEGESAGEIHLRDGRICGCFARGVTEEEAAFRMIAARSGRFTFVPASVHGALQTSRTTTQLVLEAQLRRDEKRQDGYS